MWRRRTFSGRWRERTGTLGNYSRALRTGFSAIRERGVLSNNLILEIQKGIEQNEAGFRKLPGTELRNDLTNEIVYMPPQSGDEVLRLMRNLEEYINNDSIHNTDALIKMAITPCSGVFITKEIGKHGFSTCSMEFVRPPDRQLI